MVRTIPDVPPVERDAYLAAWHAVLATESGRIVAAQLRFYLWAEAGETCPRPVQSIEQVALFQMKHEGRMEILSRIVTEATHNLSLMSAPPQPKLRPLGRVPEGT